VFLVVRVCLQTTIYQNPSRWPYCRRAFPVRHFPGRLLSPRRRLASTSRKPIIDYNPRNEKITAAALKERGYDRNGWPYGPCGILTRPNGFDFNCQRASFSCRRQCVDSKDPKIAEYAKSCSHWINYHGFTKHMSVQNFPRLVSIQKQAISRCLEILSLDQLALTRGK